jgi:dephospho-CoA kinase
VSSLRVGLTGGIGAGKSEVSRRLESYGAVVIDADLVARQVVTPGTPGLAQVVAAFGAGVLGPDGALDRERLGELVFADSSLRERLNGIVHPLVGARMRKMEEAADEAAIVVHDIPLLAEGQRAADFALVIVVDVPPEVQLARLAGRGLPEDQARARMAAQATREQRLAIADIVIDNSAPLGDLDRRVAEVWAELRSRAKQ